VPILSQLLKAEVAEREVRSIAFQIKAARFPAYKDLAGFDFSRVPIRNRFQSVRCAASARKVKMSEPERFDGSRVRGTRSRLAGVLSSVSPVPHEKSDRRLAMPISAKNEDHDPWI
jgi:hypothetical protein